jgi:hypothetical protein
MTDYAAEFINLLFDNECELQRRRFASQRPVRHLQLVDDDWLDRALAGGESS